MNDSADEAWNDLAGATSLGEALRLAKGMLRASETATPDLDARILLAHVLDVSSAAVLAYSERQLTPEQATDYASLVARRVAGEPVAYLTGHREFMGLDFHTDARALIPRPETELLVEAALVDIRTRLQEVPQRRHSSLISVPAAAPSLLLLPRWSHACRASMRPTFARPWR